MAISLNTAAPGTGEEAVAVVDTVLAASPTDELDWIEWKGALDLSSKPVQGTLARHVLGMANRLPERAVAHADGRGFVVAGQSQETAAASGLQIRLACHRASILSSARNGLHGRCTTTIAMACKFS